MKVSTQLEGPCGGFGPLGCWALFGVGPLRGVGPFFDGVIWMPISQVSRSSNPDVLFWLKSVY